MAFSCGIHNVAEAEFTGLKKTPRSGRTAEDGEAGFGRDAVRQFIIGAGAE
jgi:hypothetical protein